MKVRCLFLLLLAALSASAETYKIDAGSSQIAFTIHQFVSTVRGDFHRFSGTIEVDRQHPEGSSVIARISTHEDVGIGRCRIVLQDHRARWRPGMRRVQFLEFSFESTVLLGRGHVEQAGNIP